MYDYVPNSYDIDKMKEKNIDFDFLLKLQLKYKSSFDAMLNSMINFANIDKYINSDIAIPVLNTNETEFYKFYSKINSKYIYLRNNIHIENLSLEDIETIKSAIFDDSNLSENFLRQTFTRVLFEDGDFSFFGPATDEFLKSSKSIVLGFAFDKKDLKIKDRALVYSFTDRILNSLRKVLEPSLNVKIEMIVNNGF
jgi:hypothetical protein